MEDILMDIFRSLAFGIIIGVGLSALNRYAWNNVKPKETVDSEVKIDFDNDLMIVKTKGSVKGVMNHLNATALLVTPYIERWVEDDFQGTLEISQVKED